MESIAVSSPSQIKSADAFTYRDDGTLIPLSERFNDESDDIRYATRTKGARQPVKVGININDSTQDFTAQILRGEKTIETRDSNSLGPWVGQRVGIIRTGKGQAMLVGYMTIGEPVVYRNAREFRADETRHLVAANTHYDIKPGQTKYGYPITDVESVTPVAAPPGGWVARKMDEAEAEASSYATRTKVHRTVQRVTGEPGMATLPSDPAASYEVQSLDTIEAEVAKMKPWEQEAALAELDRIGSTPSAENRAGVIHAKRIMDFHAAGDLAAARAEVLRASRNIGVAAQLVRQAALIRGSTPEGMVFVVEEMAHDKGGELSPADRARLGTLALIDITARSATKAAEQAFETTPNPTTARALDAARLAAAKAHIRFATEASTMVPKWWSDILRMMIQGSSMSGRSIVNNLYGNYANAIPRFVQHTIAASLDGAGKAIGLWSDRQVGQPAMDAAAYVRGMVDSIRNDVLPIVKTGMTAQHLPVSGEVYQGFQPVGSVRRLATAETLTANQKAKLLVEATFGLPAEVIFRALQLGDALPRSGAYAAHLNEIARTTEALTGPAREKWLKAPPQWAQDLAMERAAEQVYQESSKITKGIVSIASAGAKGNAAQRMFNALVWRPGVMLFAATPANLAQQGAGFLAPHLALAECVWKAAHGDRRGALLAAGKAITGCMMYGAAGLLVRLGVVGGNPKDDKEAALQRETGVDPLNLNVSGMMRAKRKESPAWQPNDVQVSYRNLGFFGQVLNIVASGEDQILRDSYMAGGEIDLEPSTLSLAIAGAINVPSALLDLSMMKGTYSLLDSIMRRDYDNWFTAWMGTVANGVLPATLAQANAATRDWMPEKRYRGPGGASVLGSSIESNVRTVINDLKTRVWMADDLPPMRGLYGEKIPSTPPGANPIIYHMIDPLRARRDPGNPYAVEVARVYDATLEKRAIPPVPKGLDRVAFTDSRGRARVFKLTGRQYERMQALHGMFLRAGTRQLLSMEDYLSAPALAQARYLSAMNEAAREAARQRLAEEIRRGLR